MLGQPRALMSGPQQLASELATLGIEPAPTTDTGCAAALAAVSRLGTAGSWLQPLVDELSGAWCGAHRGRPVVGYRLSGGTWLIGGPSNPQPRLSEAWSHLQWTLPPSMVALASRHDGLGPWRAGDEGWWQDAILPIEDWESLVGRVRFGEDNILYRPEDLLRWHGDGRRGGWCLTREHGRAAGAAKWDSDTHDLSATVFLDDALNAVIAEWVALDRRVG
jgi:hypothetical protein